MGLQKSILTLGLASSILLASPQKVYADNITDRLAAWGITADMRILSTEVFNGLGFKAGYRYKVEPSYNEGLFTRLDRYYFDLNASGDTSITEAADGDFSIGLDATERVEIEFARQFLDSKEALLAKPYFIKQLPTSAEKVLKNLKVGDFVTFKANLNILTSADFVRSLGISHVGLTISANYLISGQFQVHVLKLPENKVRLKLVGLRNRSKGMSLKVGYDSVLKIVGVKVLDKRITKVLDLNPIELHFNDGNRDLFMVDYIMNLDDQEVRAAYDQVLDQALRVENLKIANPLKSEDELRNVLLMNLESVEELHKRDLSNGVVNPRIARSFKGRADSDYRNGSLKLGIRLIRMLEQRDLSKNKIVSVEKDESTKHYRLDSYRSRSEMGTLFSFFKLTKDVYINAVYETDDEFKNERPVDIVLHVERKDKRFTKNEMDSLKDQLRRTVTPEVFSQIDFGSFDDRTKKKNNVAARYILVIHPEAIFRAPELKKDEIARRYLEYIESIPAQGLPQTNPRFEGRISNSTYQEAFGRDIKRASRLLEEVLNKSLEPTQRVEAFVELRKNRLFKLTGFGFFQSLLPKDELQKLMSFNLSMESTDGDRLDFGFGDRQENDLYKRLLYIMKTFTDDGLDLRLESELLGLTLLKAHAHTTSN